MQAFPLRLIAALLLCSGVAATAADGPALGFKPGEGGLQLKLQPSLLRLPHENSGLPLFVDADNVQGHQDRELEAEGTVRLRRRGQAIYADWLRYDKPEDEVRARGNVRLEQRGDVLEGSEMRMQMESGRGNIEKPHYEVRINKTRGHGDGEQIEMESQTKFRIFGANYTSCDVGETDWFLRAKELEIDKDRQIGTARGAEVDFLGMPIFYSPYLSFSLDRERKSGFLAPTFGNTGNSGFEVSTPYYWNIAPNYDATITPRVMSKRGEMLGTQFRYLGEKQAGELRYEVLPRDHVKNDDDRFAINYRHQQRWDNGVSANVVVQKVSDSTYFTDLTTQIATTSQTILPRSGTLAKSGTWGTDGSWNTSAGVQHWQTLQANPANPVTAPYNRSQLTFAASKPNLGYTDFDVNASLVDFSQPTLTSGQRYIAYPSVTLPFQNSFGYVIPKVGMHVTRYDFDANTTTLPNQYRTLPIFSTEGGVVMERNTSMFGQKLQQTLEPKLYYVYIPTRNQNQLPVYDSAQQDVSFATLFAENQFSGADRINDANQLTTGVTSRLLQDNGVERLRAGVAQRYYFKSQEVTLPTVAPRGSNASDLLAAINGTVATHWTLDSGLQYSTAQSHIQRFNSGVRFQPEPRSVVNAAYRFTNAQATSTGTALRQIDLSTQWPITGKLSAVARYNYSIPDSKSLETLAGFEYDGGCWAFRVVAHQFTTSAATQVTSFFMQLELNGLSKIGSNPLDLLRRRIGGYARPEAPGVDTGYDGYPTR